MPKTQWKEAYYVTCYRLAVEGKTNAEMADILGVGVKTLKRWYDAKPALKEAINTGRQGKTPPGQQGRRAIPQFHDYIFNQLSPDLRDMWEVIKGADEDATTQAKADALLEKAGKYTKQNLFIYALTSSNFALSKALRRVNVSKALYDTWCQDPDFGRLIDEIKWHKDNFFEECFIRLVQTGDSPATLHAAKSRLAHRGYNPTHKLDMDAQVTQSTTVNVDEMQLPVDQRIALLTAMRLQQGKTLEGATVG